MIKYLLVILAFFMGSSVSDNMSRNTQRYIRVRDDEESQGSHIVLTYTNAVEALHRYIKSFSEPINILSLEGDDEDILDNDDKKEKKKKNKKKKDKKDKEDSDDELDIVPSSAPTVL